VEDKTSLTENFPDGSSSIKIEDPIFMLELVLSEKIIIFPREVPVAEIRIRK
jgi:hypothetical protein